MGDANENAYRYLPENQLHMVALYTCWYNLARVTAPSVCPQPWPRG